MIIRSKNGVKVELKPTRWWNIIDWCHVLFWVWRIKNNKVVIDPKDWRGAYRGGGIS